ncbi:transposase [Novosphingobium resinovorum]
MLLIGYFEGIHSERGIVWRCSDSLSLREFLRLTTREKVPDHSWMSKTRSGCRTRFMTRYLPGFWGS